MAPAIRYNLLMIDYFSYFLTLGPHIVADTKELHCLDHLPADEGRGNSPLFGQRFLFPAAVVLAGVTIEE